MLTLLARLCIPCATLLTLLSSRWVEVFFVLTNTLSFALYYSDKRAAMYGRRRIPERTLLLAAFCGGAVGAELARKYVRHKTKNWYFSATILAGMVLTIAIALLGHLPDGPSAWVTST